jgi:hypothetical protein
MDFRTASFKVHIVHIRFHQPNGEIAWILLAIKESISMTEERERFPEKGS